MMFEFKFIWYVLKGLRWKSKDRNLNKVSWKLEMYDLFIVMQLEKLIITEAVWLLLIFMYNITSKYL